MRTHVLLLAAFLTACASADSEPPPTQTPTPTPAAEPVAVVDEPAERAPERRPVEAPRPAHDDRPGIAVFPFTNGGVIGPDREDLGALEVGLQQMLLTELAQSHDLRIVERSRLNEILRELDLVGEGRVDPGTAAEVGRIVGARYAITGVFMDVFGEFRMDGRIVDVATTEVIRAVEVRARRDEIYGMLVEMADRVMRGVDLPPLPAPVREGRESRRIPAQAVILFSRAQVYEDGGRTEEAIELYRRITTDFPEMVEAQEALQQLTAVGSGSAAMRLGERGEEARERPKTPSVSLTRGGYQRTVSRSGRSM